MPARRMTSGELVKERQGVGITRGDEAVRPGSSRFTLTMPSSMLLPSLRLTWRQLYRQFGVDQAKASKVAQQAFRRDCLRELKKIKIAWPDLHYTTAKGALILSPSPPRIAPSQLRLVDT